ncbi:MAG TPA: S53 family peptidase [Gaiellaceae bacterium]|nr:S53 family peptidase [Gaiellaceae bacterium]
MDSSHLVRRHLGRAVLALSLLALLAVFGGASRAQAAAPSIRPVCGAVSLGHARCFSWVKGNALPLAQTPSGYGPADLQSAYALPSATAGSGQTVAIVDAFDDPTAEQDLADYRSHYGLPPCTTANGCFRKVNQTGGTLPMPPPGADWGLEISLDLDMVSAVCPNCHILLVEGNTNLNSDLYTAVDTAARLGANAISNSYGGNESSSETADDVHFNHPGVAITASSGDNGYGVSYPAASRYVTAVGGTSLTRGGGTRGWTESAWSGAGSGCSAYEAKPAWQTDSGCSRRTVADVSAVADSNTGVAVLYGGLWFTVGGTSASSPIVASVYALAGNASSVNYGSYPYSHTSGLFDVVSGSNGTCSPAYLCTGVAGYDGPTGLGTPNGSTGF